MCDRRYLFQRPSRGGLDLCWRRLDHRGAAFIEALIVISFMVMAFAGLMYFKSFYVRQLLAMRLARASAITYSLGACQDGVNMPEAWLGNDVGPLSPGIPAKNQEEARDERSGSSAYDQNNEDSSKFTSNVEVPGIASEGTGILNEMTAMAFSGEATVTERPSGLLAAEPKEVFKGTVQSQSHVSCSDKVSKGGIEALFDRIIGLVKAL